MRVVTFGEIMLRLTPPGYQRFRQANQFDIDYGGGEANVAVSLANYGVEVSFVTRIPDNDLGESALRTLRAAGVDTKHVVYGGKRLGIYFLEIGAVQRGGKVIYDREDSGMATISPGDIDWNTVFEGAGWFHWSGITPAVSQSAADVCLEACKQASARGLTISTDLNYREKLWKYGKKPREVMPSLIEYSDVILGGGWEAEEFFGIHLPPPGAHKDSINNTFLPFARELKERFPRIKKVVTTLRNTISASHNNWSAVLWDGETVYNAPKYKLTHIVDRVGGGDSFMGALIYGLLTWPDDIDTVLRFAVAASALKHTIEGDVNLVTKEEVIKLMEGDGSGRVSR